MVLGRKGESEALSHSDSHLTQASQNLGPVRQIEAEGCGGTVSSGFEIRHVLQILGRELTTLLFRERSAVAPPRGDQQQPQELGQADRDQSRTSFGRRTLRLTASPLSPAIADTRHARDLTENRP
ncbi:hypothetical protein [Streptomyces murinus]|uniref:hypothetical protein n=1 Tax=Streptomyces murinus TaxID=33900 RepID=UPI003729DC84